MGASQSRRSNARRTAGGAAPSTTPSQPPPPAPSMPPQQQQAPPAYQPTAQSQAEADRAKAVHKQAALVIEQAWVALTAVVFELGEKELSRNGGQGFSTQADQTRCIDRWCFKAVQVMVSRRHGNSDSIELVTGHVLTEAKVPKVPQLQAMYRCVIQAQVGNGQDADIQRVVMAFMSLPGFREKMQESANLLAAMYCPDAEPPATVAPPPSATQRGPLTMDDIWDSFFASLFRVAEEALQKGMLTKDDVTEQEPWVYIGFTSATALETVLRAPPTGPMVLAFGGKSVTQEMVPPEAAELFAAFLQLRDAVTGSNLNPEEMALLRRKALWADREDRDLDVSPKLTRLVGGLQSIAARASQHGAFKRNFQNTLDLLEATVQSSN